MAELIYSAITSLDGYLADPDGGFDWAVPDAEVLGYVSELERPIGTYLYGRRTYELMIAWENDPEVAARSAEDAGFAEVWRAASKVVYSTTLEAVSTRSTRLERQFRPADVEALKEAAESDLSVAGPTLAGHALRAGVVDRCHLFVVPALVGGGLSAFPADVRLDLELLGERRFGNGFLHLDYRVGRPRPQPGAVPR